MGRGKCEGEKNMRLTMKKYCVKLEWKKTNCLKCFVSCPEVVHTLVKLVIVIVIV